MKKGYVFTLDAAIAIFILMIGFALIYFQFAREGQTTYVIERLSQDVIGVLSHTRVSDICYTSPENCRCPSYPKLTTLVCGSGDTESGLRSSDPTILEMFAEVIETGTRSGKDVEEAIHEIFVTNKVIDEKRFGFSVLYTNFEFPVTLELYNSETYPSYP